MTATYLGKGNYVASSSPAKTVKVVKASAASLKVTAKKFKKGTKPSVTVKVGKLNNGSYYAGKITLTSKGKVVKTVTIKASAKGKVTVKLNKKYLKSFTVKAKIGTSTVATKTSAATSVKVK